MTHPSRQKGNRLERAAVDTLQEAGIAAARTPLSGSLGGKYRSDLDVPVLGHDWKVECKARASGFKQAYAWLAGNDALIIKADRKEPLVVLSLRKAVDLLREAEGYRTKPLQVSAREAKAA